MPVDLHAEMLVGRDQFLVLRLRDLDVAGRFAQMFARQRTGRQMAQIGRRAEQHVGQRVGFVAKPQSVSGLVPPSGLRRWSEKGSS